MGYNYKTHSDEEDGMVSIPKGRTDFSAELDEDGKPLETPEEDMDEGDDDES